MSSPYTHSTNDYSLLFSSPNLSEAAFLKHELELKNIFAELVDPLPNEQKHTLWVKKSDFSTATAIKEQLMPEQNIDPVLEAKQLRKNHIKRSIYIGILGLFTGMRLGAKVKSPVYFTLAVLGCGALTFTASYFAQNKFDKK